MSTPREQKKEEEKPYTKGDDFISQEKISSKKLVVSVGGKDVNFLAGQQFERDALMDVASKSLYEHQVAAVFTIQRFNQQWKNKDLNDEKNREEFLNQFEKLVIVPYVGTKEPEEKSSKAATLGFDWEGTGAHEEPGLKEKINIEAADLTALRTAFGAAKKTNTDPRSILRSALTKVFQAGVNLVEKETTQQPSRKILLQETYKSREAAREAAEVARSTRQPIEDALVELTNLSKRYPAPKFFTITAADKIGKEVKDAIISCRALLEKVDQESKSANKPDQKIDALKKMGPDINKQVQTQIGKVVGAVDKWGPAAQQKKIIHNPSSPLPSPRTPTIDTRDVNVDLTEEKAIRKKGFGG